MPASGQAGVELLLPELGRAAFPPHRRVVSATHPLGKHFSSTDENFPGGAQEAGAGAIGR